MKILSITLITLLSMSSFASELFVMKKSLNPGNVLHFTANMDGCNLKSPGVEAHWVMGEESGQIEELNKKERKYFSPIISYLKESETDFTFGALKLVGDSLPDTNITVRVVDCAPQAFIEFYGQEVKIDEIYVDGKLNLALKWKTNYLVIKGVNADGTSVSQRFDP